jgi:hypothetical protein
LRDLRNNKTVMNKKTCPQPPTLPEWLRCRRIAASSDPSERTPCGVCLTYGTRRCFCGFCILRGVMQQVFRRPGIACRVMKWRGAIAKAWIQSVAVVGH